MTENQKEIPQQKQLKQRSNKTYFAAQMHEWAFRFVWEDDSVLHWAGGGENQGNFFLRKLIELYGKEVGVDVYKKTNAALLAISKEPTNWKFPKASLVRYPSQHDNSGRKQRNKK